MIPYYIPAGVSRAELVVRDVGGRELNTHDLGSSSLRWRNVYGVNGDFSTVTVSGLTQGSVIFAGTGGALSEDNANFFWDDANNQLGIGTSSPMATLHVAGTGRFDGNLRVDGNTTLGDDAAVDRVTLNARVQSDVVPSADNTYDLGENTTPLRWRSGYFGTQVKVGASVSLVAATNELEYTGGDGRISVAGASALRVSTNGAERLRVEGSGDVVVQNQAGGTTVLRVLGGGGGTGATQVVLQAGTGQGGVNLLEWRNGAGQAIGVIDDAGFMSIGVNNPGFSTIAAHLHVYSNTAEPAAVFENGIVRIGNIGGSGVSAGPDLQVWDEPGATQVILQLGTAQTGVNLLEWQNAGGTVLGGIDDAGNLFVNTNTTLGDDPGDVVRVKAGTVELPNIPTAAATDEVLRIDPTTGEVTRSTVADVISAGIIKGSFSITTPGSSFLISVPGDIQSGAIVTVTLVGPIGGTIYPLMVTNVNHVAETITVESSGTIPAGYAIHYIIINP
jgi:hypothetical protein